MADLQIAYDGDALRSGLMDVRELAPALLAVGDLAQAANSLANNDRATIATSVRALERGSFSVDLVLNVVPTLKNAAGLLPGHLTQADELAALLFGGQVSLITLIKLLRGRPIQPTETHPDGSVTVDFGNATINAPVVIAPVLKHVYENDSARHAAHRLVKPLETDGIDVFKIRKDRTVVAEVAKAEAPFFQVPENLSEIFDSAEAEREAFLQVVTASFEDRYQWRFNDGHAPLTAKIEDRAFFEGIDAGKRFGKGDVLRVRLHQHQWRDSKGLHIEYRILEVLEVLPPRPTQTRLV